MKRLGVVVAVIAMLGGCGVASAEEAPRMLRVLGEATSPPPEGMPARFVIDAVIKTDDDPFKADIEGWMAGLGPGAQGDDIEGTCVEARCAISVSFGYDKLALSADLAGPAPGTGRLIMTDSDDKKVGEVAVRFTPVAGPVEGLGELAAPDAIRSVELADLLMWNGASTGFSNVRDEPIDWIERGGVADWQQANERPGAGLILAEDLALLRKTAAAAKSAAGWTPVGGKGWSAGYPAAVLPIVETVGSERRFSSADGKLRLVIAIDPPMSEEAFDAFVEKITEDQPGIERRGYTRVNSDMEITWIEKGRLTSAAYHNRENGFVRLEYSVPEKDEAGDTDWGTILPRALRADDDLAP